MRFTITSETAPLKLYDGRMNHNNGWFVLPAILCVISMLILIFGYRINNDVLTQAQKEIAERQDNE